MVGAGPHTWGSCPSCSGPAPCCGGSSSGGPSRRPGRRRAGWPPMASRGSEVGLAEVGCGPSGWLQAPAGGLGHSSASPPPDLSSSTPSCHPGNHPHPAHCTSRTPFSVPGVGSVQRTDLPHGIEPVGSRWGQRLGGASGTAGDVGRRGGETGGSRRVVPPSPSSATVPRPRPTTTRSFPDAHLSLLTSSPGRRLQHPLPPTEL